MASQTNKNSNNDGSHIVYRRQMSYSESLEEVKTIERTFNTSDRKRNGEIKSDSYSSPKKVERKSKFASISRLFKPWKWKRRKKSDKIQETSIDLERKISVRATRAELIQKGVLKADLVSSDNNHATDMGGIVEATETEVEDTRHGDSGGGDNASPQNKVTENGRASAEVTTLATCHGDRADVHPAEEQAAGTTEAEINSSCNNAKPAARGNTQTSMRPVMIPTSAPPPYNPVHAHIIVPSSSTVIVDITNKPAEPVHTSSMPQDSIPNAWQQLPSEPPHPYETVRASEPDFNKLPKKSALKGRHDMNTAKQNTARVSPRNSPMFPVESDTSSQQGSLPRRSVGPLCGGVRVLPSVPSPRKPVPKPRVTVGFSENKENVPEPTYTTEPATSYHNDQPDYDNVHDSDSSDSDDIQYRDDLNDSNSLAAKVARQDSLARFLSNRPTHIELVQKNIIPTRSEAEKMDDRETIGNKLIRRLSLRPTHEELKQRNILRLQSSEEHRTLMDERRRYLIRKLSFRPSIEELRERKIIRFNDYIEVTHAHEYDRRADKPWTRLTPHDKASIRQELNEFKEQEMDVHKESRHLTRFHRP